MSTVHVVLAAVTDRGRAQTGATLPLPNSVPVSSDTVNSGATSAPSSLVGQLGQAWVIVSTAAVWAKFGPSASPPTAAADDGWYIPAGVPMSFAVTTADEVVALKDA